jgi:hypothetical protein
MFRLCSTWTSWVAGIACMYTELCASLLSFDKLIAPFNFSSLKNKFWFRNSHTLQYLIYYSYLLSDKTGKKLARYQFPKEFRDSWKHWKCMVCISCALDYYHYTLPASFDKLNIVVRDWDMTSASITNQIREM